MSIKSSESENYLAKIESSFGVITHSSDCHIVTRELNITPTRFRQKGDESRSEHSAKSVVARYGIWEITKITIGENPNLSEHIEYFQNMLSEKLEAIQKLKSYYKFECVFYVLTTTDDTVGGFELNDEELLFIREISNRFTFRFSTNLERI